MSMLCSQPASAAPYLSEMSDACLSDTGRADILIF